MCVTLAALVGYRADYGIRKMQGTRKYDWHPGDCLPGHPNQHPELGHHDFPNEAVGPV